MRSDSRASARLDAVLIVLGLASIMIVTYEFAFVHEPRLGTSIVIYAIDAVFLIATRTELRTGYRDRGIEVTDPGAVRHHYSRSRRAVRLVGSVPFDVLFIWVAAAPLGIALVMWVRLLRLARIGEIFGGLRRLERHPGSNTALLRIIRLAVLVGLVFHLLACLWYLIPFVSGFPEGSWPVTEDALGLGPGGLYLLSAYWVVTAATTVGFGDILPGTGPEYLFATAVMLIGASLFAYVIASGAALISSLNLSKASFWGHVEKVESFLRSRHVDEAVSTDVRSYYEYVWARHSGLTEDTLLSDLPPTLRVDVLRELLGSVLAQVPLFEHASPALSDELIRSLHRIITPPAGYLVIDGEVADGIYFIASGSAEVVTEGGERVHATLEAGDYFGDLSLLLGERRTASIRSVTFTEVFLLDAAAYNRLGSEYPELKTVLAQASKERSPILNELVVEGLVL